MAITLYYCSSNYFVAMTPDFRDFVHIEQLKDQKVAPPAKGVTTLGQEKEGAGNSKSFVTSPFEHVHQASARRGLDQKKRYLSPCLGVKSGSCAWRR